MARKPFKKDLTPIGRRGTITTHTGKGAREQRNYPGARESLTGGSPFDRMSNNYPKPAPAPSDNDMDEPGLAPSAMMPPDNDRDEA